MGEARPMSAAEVWSDAERRRLGWSGPLTWSLGVTGARALALSRTQGDGRFEVLGASAGAPVEFLNLCRDLVGGAAVAGTQERYVTGLGRLAWSVITTANVSVILFGLYENLVDLDILNHITMLGQQCVSGQKASA